MRHRKRRAALAAALLLIVAAVLYNAYDNARVIVVEQTVVIQDLPEEFDGYRILQLSDLHGRYFGEAQSKLLAAVNGTQYDCLLLTGDMNQYETSDSASSQAVFDLLNGLKDREAVFWVDGNTGPFAAESVSGSCTGALTDAGVEIEKAGASVLLTPVELTRDGARIWLVPELSLTDIQMNYLSLEAAELENQEAYRRIAAHGQALERWYARLNGNGEVKIRVDHFPMQANMTEEDWAALGFLDYDLSISGHYHGGQLRLPLLGALYIPSPTAGIGNGYFPAQNEVKGLNRILKTQQYISAGLGSSASISFLNFRLFNTPEINLLTLRRG